MEYYLSDAIEEAIQNAGLEADEANIKSARRKVDAVLNLFDIEKTNDAKYYKHKTSSNFDKHYQISRKSNEFINDIYGNNYTGKKIEEKCKSNIEFRNQCIGFATDFAKCNYTYEYYKIIIKKLMSKLNLWEEEIEAEESMLKYQLEAVLSKKKEFKKQKDIFGEYGKLMYGSLLSGHGLFDIFKSKKKKKKTNTHTKEYYEKRIEKAKNQLNQISKSKADLRELLK